MTTTLQTAAAVFRAANAALIAARERITVVARTLDELAITAACDCADEARTAMFKARDMLADAALIDEPDDRASIIAFIEREGTRLLAESYKNLPRWEVQMLRAKVSQCCEIAGQVQRDEDRRQ